MIFFGHLKRAEVAIGRPIMHDPFVIEFAAMGWALEPGPKYL